jgi:hypothetical protein
VVAVLFKIAHEAPDLGLLPRSPEWATLCATVSRALARQPDARYPDARSMAADLLQALTELGGTADWATASDRGLIMRQTPRPMRRETLAPSLPVAEVVDEVSLPLQDQTGEGAPDLADGGMASGRRASQGWLWLGVTAGALSFFAILVAAVVWFLRPVGLPARPTEAKARSATVGLAPERTPVARPTTSPVAYAPAGRPSLASSPSPAPRPPAQPSAAPQAPGSGRLERANALLEAGRFQGALSEARAVLARDPGNEDARAVAEDAEAALVVESRIRKAREAMRRGDTQTARAEVEAGLAVAPSDARLLALFKDLTR